MKLLTVIYKDGTDLMNYYLDVGPCGTLIVKDYPKAPIGAKVWMKASMRATLESIYFTGRVIARQVTHHIKARPFNTMHVTLDPDEHQAQRGLLRWIRHDLEDFDIRSTLRREIRLNAELHHNSFRAPFHCMVKNISMDGVYVQSALLLPKHTKVQLRLTSSAYEVQRSFLCEVMRVEKTDLDNGMGVRFIGAELSDRRRLQSLLRTIDKAQLAPRLPATWWGQLAYHLALF